VRAGTSRALLGAYGVLVGVILAGFLLRYPVPELLPKLASILSAVWFVYALHACGRFLRTALESRAGDATQIGEWGNRLTNALIGFGVVGFTVILLGWAVPGDLRLKLRIVFGILFAVSAADWLVARKTSNGFRWPRWEMPALLAALPAAGCIAAFLSSFTPITHYDALVYHLSLPSVYLRQGAIDVVPFNFYSFFPAATEMSFLFILSSLPAPEYTINVTSWILTLVLGGAVAEWSANIGGPKQGWLSALIWWTTPLVLLLSQGAYVDLPLAAATFLAVRWHVMGRTGDRRALVLAGIAVGIAFSIKYTGALTGMILGIDLAIQAARRRISLRSVFLFGAAALLSPAPWLVKNLLAVGNPVFPFFYQSIGTGLSWTTAAADGYFRMLSEYGPRNNAIFDLFSGPWGPAVSGSARGGFDLLGDFGWPIVLLGAPLAFFLRKEKADVKLLSAYALAHFIGWYAAKPVLRFLISVFPIGVILASIAIHSLMERGRWTRIFTVLLLVPWIVSNVFLYGLVAGELKLFSVPFGKTEPNDYLRQRLSFYPTSEALNAELPAGEGVLLIGEQRTYHLRVPFLSSNLFSPSPISEICNSSTDPTGIIKDLQARSVSAIVVNEAEIRRLGGLARFGFTAAGETALRRVLTDHTIVLSQDRGIFLHKITPRTP